MTSPETNEQVTLSLDYEDPLMPSISPDEIIGRGVRARRRNRIVRACGTLCVAAIVAAVVITQIPGKTSSPPAPAAVSPLKLLAATSAYKQHTPAGTPVMVDQSVPGWQSYVWLSVDGQYCSGTIGVSPQDQYQESIVCITPGVGFGQPNKSGPPNQEYSAATVPEFEVLPPTTDRVLVVGLALDDVASIEIQFLGNDVMAKVYPFELANGAKYAAYAAWLPLDGRTSYGTSDITAFIARNKSGEVLTG